MHGWLSSLLSIVGIGMQNSRDSELKADGARKVELESRDKQDAVRSGAKEHRKINNSATDGKVSKRL